MFVNEEISDKISIVANLMAGACSIFLLQEWGFQLIRVYRFTAGGLGGLYNDTACFKAKPNSAHRVISLIQKFKPDTWVLTQNIDGLHRAADNKNLIDITW